MVCEDDLLETEEVKAPAELDELVAAEPEVTAPLVSEAMELPPEVDMAPEPEVRSDCSVVYLEDPPEMPEVTEPEAPETGVDLRVVVAAESEVTAPLVSEAMELPPEVDMTLALK